jgi:peptidyl-prolyl cis-trans isomerase D
MLEAIRTRASSLVVKLLFLLLVLSFVLWGIADVFFPGRGASWAAKVGDVTISEESLTSEYRDGLRRLGQVLGQPVEPEQARQLGLPLSVLNRMVNRVMLDQEVADLGLAVSDALVRKAIASDRQFQDPSGTFDPEILRQALRVNGISEDGYVRMLREQIGRDQLVESVVTAAAVPQPLVEWLYRYRNQRRNASYAVIADAAMTDVGKANEPELRQYHQEHATQFMAPEYRAVTAVILTPADVAQTIAVSDDDVRRAYEERAHEFQQPERRSFQQMVFGEKAAAEQARARVVEGGDFAAVARTLLGADAKALEVTGARREDVPAEIAGALFGLQPGAVSLPVQSPLGWHVLMLTRVDPGSQAPLAAVTEQLRADVARDRAIEQIIDIGQRLEDALGGGASLPEAAAQLGLSVRTLSAIDAAGRDASGQAVADLPTRFAETAFATNENAESLLTEADGGIYFVVRVDKITAPALREFETVRLQVTDAWTAGRRRERARDQAEKLAAAVRGGRAFDAAARDAGATAARLLALTRGTAGTVKTVPPAFIEQAFAGKPGDVFVVEGKDAVVVGRLESIEDPAAEGGDAERDGIRRELTDSLQDDLLQQLLAALRQQYPVRVNDSVFERL